MRESPDGDCPRDAPGFLRQRVHLTSVVDDRSAARYRRCRRRRTTGGTAEVRFETSGCMPASRWAGTVRRGACLAAEQGRASGTRRIDCGAMALPCRSCGAVRRWHEARGVIRSVRGDHVRPPIQRDCTGDGQEVWREGRRRGAQSHRQWASRIRSVHAYVPDAAWQ